MKLFDLKGYKPQSREFELMPAGKYKLTCVDAQFKQSEKGGTYIKAAFSILEGLYARRQIFMNFNLSNPNEKAVEIGKENIWNYFECAGKNPELMGSPSDFVGLNVTAMVKITPPRDGYNAKNEIHYFVKNEPQAASQDVGLGFKFDNNDRLPF